MTALSPRQSDVGDRSVSFPARTPTRTLAILAKDACNAHRSAIQAQITSNGFAIVDECLEEWSSERDVAFVKELLQHEQEPERWIERLTDAPIYLMVLERYRAPEMWHSLCGTEGDQEGKSGLRQRYGADALYASPTSHAEHQIALCFPELAIEELAGEQSDVAPTLITAVNSNGAFVVRENGDVLYDEHGQAFDANTGELLELQQDVSLCSAMTATSPAKSFKARPMPSSYKQSPVIQPRLSRAAALRMGVAVPEPARRMSVTSLTNASSNTGMSGVPKSTVAVPKSLAAPTIAPRMNRNALARTSKAGLVTTTTAAAASSSSDGKERRPVDYSNTPGHKRMSLSANSTVASLAAPTVAPRLNKAAAARVANAAQANGVAAPNTPSSFMRSTRTMSAAAAPRFDVHRTASPSPANVVRRPVDYSTTPGHKRVTTTSMSATPSGNSTLKSLQAPTIVPRANRASLARTSVGAGGLMDGISKIKLATPDNPIRSASRLSGVGVFASPPSDKENVHLRPASAMSSATATRRDRHPVDYSTTPGHKRSTSALGNRIASLAQPTIVPRLNTATQKRLSVGGAASATIYGGVAASTNMTSTRVRVRASGPPPSAFRM